MYIYGTTVEQELIVKIACFFLSKLTFFLKQLGYNGRVYCENIEFKVPFFKI